MKRILKQISELIFPPRCAGCHTLLPTGEAGGVFCAECEREFEREMRMQCPKCHAAHCECRCQPFLMKQAGCRALIKLAPYGEGEAYYVVRRMLLDMKKRPCRRKARYLASQLCQGVLEMLRKEGVSKEQCVITYLPRSPRNRRRDGVDQAKELALSLSECTGIAERPLLKRKGHTKQQKGLNARERARNLEGAFSLCEDVRGLFVLVVDDVVTTGAGMRAVARELRRGGASGVLGICVAVTEKRKRQKS